MQHDQQHLTTDQLGARWLVSSDHVRALIARGVLRAIDVSLPGSRRPTWRIRMADVLAYEELRVTPTPAPKTPRVKKQPAGAFFNEHGRIPG